MRIDITKNFPQNPDTLKRINSWFPGTKEKETF